MKNPQYPADILSSLRDRWREAGAVRSTDCQLPGDAILRPLLDIAYQASFHVDEQRNTSVTIVLGSRDELRACAAAAPVEFPVARAFTAGEVSRLAPATDARQTMLCVAPDRTRTGGAASLSIWGLLDVGSSWAEFAVGERSDTVPPPDLLTITVSQPGALTLSRSGSVLLRLRNGVESFPKGSVLEEGPVSRRFESAAAYASGRLTEMLAAEGVQAAPEEFSRSMYMRFTRRLLYRVRSKRHGGTILVVPDSLNATDSELTDRLLIKYPLRHSGVREDVLRFVVDRRMHAELRSIVTRSGTPVADPIEAIRRHDLSEFTGQRRVAEHAAFIADLAGVDGALILTDRWRILGFGAEVVVSSPALMAVQIARDPEGTVTEPLSIDAYGTRHRSAIRFCHSFEPSVAFVVSQDGGVRAVARVGENAVVWPEINAGDMGV